MEIKRWNLPRGNLHEIGELSRESGLPWVLCAVLSSRGVSSAAGAKAFIEDTCELEDPFKLKDMDKAAARVLEAIEYGERIAVYGDYDCDGITATALLTSYLQSAGADVIYYVPSREKEGYGLNKPAIEMLRGQNTELIITVDNGVSAHDEIAFANSLGIDVVVTDHHTPRATLPDAVAVVNPHRADCTGSLKDLAGVGVAFKLVCALENARPAELLEYYSDLVALGTIADVVPLTGENRVIVKHGLSLLCDSERSGIAALIEVCGLTGKSLNCESVAFGIIPRINAAGRMGCVDDVIEMLLTDDSGYAQEIAEAVNVQNAERKKAEEQIVREVEDILRGDKDILKKRVIVVHGGGWHHGVAGIVASKLMEKYGKPCILISSDGKTARGSGRSLEGFSLIGAITACSKYLTQFGGHTLAAGITLPADAVADFDAAMQAYARENYPHMPSALLKIDCEIPPERLTVEEISALNALEPFGAANESPLFLLRGLVIDGIYPTTDQKHIRIKFSTGGAQLYAVYFRMSESDFPYHTGDVADVVAGISVSEYNGRLQLSIKIRDLRPSGVQQEQILAACETYSQYLRGEYAEVERPDRLLPDREDLAVAYRFLRKCGGYTYGEVSMYYRIMDSGIDFCRMLVALDIMRELGLIERGRTDGGLSVVPNPPQVNIDDSVILQNLKAEMQVTKRG